MKAIDMTDRIDAKLLWERVAAFNAIPGVRIGDFVRMLDGTLRRFAHDWGEDIQPSAHPDRFGRGSIYFDPPYLSYSGALDPAISKSCLRDTGETMHSCFWFFHHNFTGADRGVSFYVQCRIYEQTKGERS